MKKIITLILAVLLFVTVLTGCGYNKQIFDVNYKFNYAVVNCLDGTTESGRIKSWNDYDDSDMIQVTFENGKVFYTHGSNIVLSTKN